MKNNKKIDLMQLTLRVGLCLFLLSGTGVLYAQDTDDDDSAEDDVETPVRKPKKITAPIYEMKSLSGVVVDAATGQPMAGVRVQALNNALYTAMTDEQGKYEISVPVFVTALYYSVSDYNGLQLAVKGDKMPDAKLQSVAFKPYYHDGTDILSKSQFTLNNTSALTVESDMENSLNSDVRMINRGGLPAQGAAMFIGGLNSLNSISQPLVVVDGVEWDMQYDRSTIHQGFVNNVLNMLDVDDIESVQVLKNGTTLYGAKGANGVILINTKRGKSMATRINARVYGGFEVTPSTTDVMNASQYRSYLSELLGTNQLAADNSANTYIGFLNEDPNYTYYNLYHNKTDWSKDLYKTAFTQNYKINVEGGDEVAIYNLSLGYSGSQATAKKNDFSRLNIRFNTDVKILDNLSTSLDLAYSRATYNLRDNGWAENYNHDNIASPNVLGLIQAPFLSPYSYVVAWDYDNNRNVLRMNRNEYSGKYYDDNPNPFLFASNYNAETLANPYWILKNGQGDNKNYHEQTQFSLNIRPELKLGNDWTISDRFSYLLNRTSEKYYLPVNGTPRKFIEGLGRVSSSVKTQFGKETTVFNDLRIEWKKQMGAHFADIIGGFRAASYTYSDNYVYGYNNSNDKMPNLSYDLDYLSYGGSNDTWLNLAYYLNGQYNFRNRYFLDATLTMESSSRFGKEASDGMKMFGVRWAVFPALQLGWVISNEDWFKSKAVNYLKLTAGVETSGNDNIDYYASRTYFANVKFLDRATALQLANIENPKIQWETTRRFNIGAQTSLFNNRWQMALELFFNRTSNLLTRKALSYVSGLPYIWTNDGTLRNNGVNFSTDVILLNTKDWKWQIGASLGHYSNKITDLGSSNVLTLYNLDANGNKASVYKTIKGYTSSVYGTNNILTAVNNPVGVFYGYKTKGVFKTEEAAANASEVYGYLRYPTGFTGNPYKNFRAGDVHFVDVNNDGWISDADMVKIGDPNPDVYGNIYTSVTWKNFTLDLNFKYSIGNDIFNYQRAMLEQGSNTMNQSRALVNRWTHNNQSTDIPRVIDPTSDEWVNNERFSDRWIENGSYLKFKKLRLTYRLPLSLSWLQGITVFGEANNIFTITKYLGEDPEVYSGNGVLYQGIDSGLLPQTFNCNFGITLNL